MSWKMPCFKSEKQSVVCRSFKIGVLKNFANFTGKILCWSYFLIKSQGWKNLQLYQKEAPAHVFSCEIWEFLKNTFFLRKPLWWLLLKLKKFWIWALFVMINFLFETCGFTNNPHFILFKWRLIRKHSPAKSIFLWFPLYTINCKNFNQAYTMEDPHKRKTNLIKSTYLIKRRDNKHICVRKILFRTESN